MLGHRQCAAHLRRLQLRQQWLQQGRPQTVPLAAALVQALVLWARAAQLASRSGDSGWAEGARAAVAWGWGWAAAVEAAMQAVAMQVPVAAWAPQEKQALSPVAVSAG